MGYSLGLAVRRRSTIGGDAGEGPDPRRPETIPHPVRPEQDNRRRGNPPGTGRPSGGTRSSASRAGGIRADRHQKAVTPPGNGLDKSRILGAVAQGVAEPADGGVETVIEIDKGVGGPQTAPQLVPRNHLSRPFQQQGQESGKGCSCSLTLAAVAPQFCPPADRLRRPRNWIMRVPLLLITLTCVHRAYEVLAERVNFFASPTLLSI